MRNFSGVMRAERCNSPTELQLNFRQKQYGAQNFNFDRKLPKMNFPQILHFWMQNFPAEIIF